MQRLADIYYAFHFVHGFNTDPFTGMQPEMLLQVSRFLLNTLGNGEAPLAVSRSHTLFTLAKQAKVLGGYKLARFAYDRLQQQRLPGNWQDQVDLDMLTIQAKPVRDAPELLPVCYRCGATNPLINPYTSDACTTCGHKFIRSFISFEVLPLVEFGLEEGVDDEEALTLIRTHAGGGKGKGSRGDKWREEKDGEANVMTLGSDDEEEEGEDGDLFNACINDALEKQEDEQARGPISGGNDARYIIATASRRCLAKMTRSEAFYIPGIGSRRGRFYKNMMPEISVAVSQPCGKFFHEEDFEFSWLKEGHCGYCRETEAGDYSSI
ncbi:unnamed protein product [Chrysoparadoxa australica]